jgi:hypothetical protein
MDLDFIGAVVLTAVMVVGINAIIGALPVAPAIRLAIAGVAGVWIGAQVALATAGAFTSEAALTLPLIGVMVAAPVVAAGVLAAFSPGVRAALLAIPLPLLVGLHAGRLLGVFFLLLAASGRLGGPFPHFAGWGDIAVGAVALPLAIALAAGRGRRTALVWNLFGIVDLLLAVGLGTLSFNGFAMQVFQAGAGSDAVQRLPWSLIPTVLVPMYLITHGIIHARLMSFRDVGGRLSVA